MRKIPQKSRISKFELSVLLDQDDKIEIQLIVSDQPIIMAPPSESDITVFRRRE